MNRKYCVKVDGHIAFRGTEEECMAFIEGVLYVDVDYAKTFKVNSIKIEVDDSNK